MSTTKTTLEVCIKNLINECSKYGKQVKSEIVSNAIEKDVRYLFYQMYSSEMTSIYSALKVVSANACNFEFWESEVGIKNEMNDEFCKKMIYNILQSFRTTFYISTMVNYETCFRSIAKKILVDYHFKMPMDKISKRVITECNLANDYYELNRILNYLRNSMHDGWIQRESTISVSYQFNTFSFEENKAIKISNEELEFLIKELMDFWSIMVLSPPIKEIVYIEHPNFAASE